LAEKPLRPMAKLVQERTSFGGSERHGGSRELTGGQAS
jgi:hypothetical protein